MNKKSLTEYKYLLLSHLQMDVDDIILLLAFDAITDEEAALFILILDEERKIPKHLRYG